MSVTVLKELLDKYGDVCDNDDASRRYLEQYAVQVGGGGECEGQIVSAIRRVVQDGCDLRSVEACLEVLILLILKQIVRDEGRFVRSVIMHRNSSETPSLLLARKRSQNNSPPIHCVATQSRVRRVGESDDRPSVGIDHSKLWDCPPGCVRASVEAVPCSVHRGQAVLGALLPLHDIPSFRFRCVRCVSSDRARVAEPPADPRGLEVDGHSHGNCQYRQESGVFGE